MVSKNQQNPEAGKRKYRRLIVPDEIPLRVQSMKNNLVFLAIILFLAIMNLVLAALGAVKVGAVFWLMSFVFLFAAFWTAVFAGFDLLALIEVGLFDESVWKQKLPTRPEVDGSPVMGSKDDI